MNQAIAKGRFTPQTGDKTPVQVHFNPVSLQLSINNTLEDKGKGKDHKQFITKTAAKLTMDLIFDTTHRGTDVRLETGKIAKFMEPGKQAGDQKIPTILLFEWGTFKFQGLLESYKETLDFFSAEGLPLRASLNLTLSRQEEVFEPSPANQQPPDQSVDIPAGGGQGAAQLASLGGAPDAGRAIATQNNQDSLRFPSGPFTLDPSIQLSPPVAFASGGLGLNVGISAGISAGFGVGISAGLSLGISGGISLGASVDIGARIGLGSSGGVSASGGLGNGLTSPGGAGIASGALANGRISSGIGTNPNSLSNGRTGTGFSGSAGIPGGVDSQASSPTALINGASAMDGALGVRNSSFGSTASAGVAATEGAFAGLRTPTPRRQFARLNTDRFRQRDETAPYTTSQQARFELGGRASTEGSASLTIDVTASQERSRLQFEES
jgi:hypothetical protein